MRRTTDFADGKNECGRANAHQPRISFHCEEINPNSQNRADCNPRETGQKEFHAAMLMSFRADSSPQNQTLLGKKTSIRPYRLERGAVRI